MAFVQDLSPCTPSLPFEGINTIDAPSLYRCHRHRFTEMSVVSYFQLPYFLITNPWKSATLDETTLIILDRYSSSAMSI